MSKFDLKKEYAKVMLRLYGFARIRYSGSRKIFIFHKVASKSLYSLKGPMRRLYLDTRRSPVIKRVFVSTDVGMLF